MLFERRLVQSLDYYNVFKGTINHNNFVDYMLNKKWPRINYYFYYKGDVFKRKVEIAINDCIGRKFILNDKNSGNISVTEQGRDYIKPIGFLEEYLKRRKRTIVGFVGLVVSLLITYLITYYGNK